MTSKTKERGHNHVSIYRLLYLRESKDNKQMRYQIVISVEKHGIKKTTEYFKTTRNTVRKWYRRWAEKGYKGLEELSRRPHNSPLATSREERKKLVKLKKKYKRIGADTIKVVEDIPLSVKIMKKIWREEGISSRKRRKKHVTKQNLREVKRQWALFQQIRDDVFRVCG